MNKLLLSLFGLLFSISTFGQVNLTGKIVDRNDEVLPAATIFVKETETVTIADENGNFKIANLKNAVYNVKFSFVGYQEVWKKIDLIESGNMADLTIQMNEKIINLDNATVVSTRAGNKTPFTYSTVNREEIEAQNLGQDVPFLLRWTPSAVVTSDAGAGIGYTYMRIRGTDGSRTNVTINGIPINDAESQGVFWVNMPDFLSSTNDIQIQRGVGTSTNGVGAFGASINMNTTKMKKDAYGEVEASGGSFNTRRAMAQFGSGLINNKFTFDGRISRINSDGYINRASSDLESYYLSGAYFGDKSSLRLTVFGGHEVTYQAWYGIGYEDRNDRDLRRANFAGAEKTGEPHDNEVDDYQQTHVQLHYNKMFNQNWNLNLGAHYTKGQGFFEQYKADEPFEDYNLKPVISPDSTVVFTDTDLIRRRWLDNDFYGVTWALNYIQDDNRLQFTFGGAANNYDGDHFGEVIWAERLPENTDPKHRYYFGNGEKLDINAFAKTSYQLTNNLNGFLDLQVRTIDFDITGTDNDLRDVTTDDQLTFFNPKVGLFYEMNPQTNLYASFGRTSREPARGDYTDIPIDANPAAERPKPDAETLNNVEVGFKRNFQKAAINVNLYYMGYEDQLIPTGAINDVGSPVRVNVDKSYRAGIELVGGINLTPKLRFDGTAAFSQNKIDSFTEFTEAYDDNGDYFELETKHEDTDIAFSPNVIVSGGLSYNFLKNDRHNGSISLLSKYVGEQFLDNTSNEDAKLDAYFISDLRVNYAIKTKFIKEITFTFLVQNLFDELYANNGGVYRFYNDDGNDEVNAKWVFPQATRNFLLGVGFKF